MPPPFSIAIFESISTLTKLTFELFSKLIGLITGKIESLEMVYFPREDILVDIFVIELYCFILIAIVLGIAWVWRKRQLPRYHKIDYSNIETPYARASRRLGELDDSGLIKEYYAGLSHISREYIETKYFIRTLEMTTEEIDGARKLFPVKSDHLSEWIEFLYAADQVKYARSIPKAEMMLIHKNKVKSMIEQL